VARLTNRNLVLPALICGICMALSASAGADERAAESFAGECALSGVVRHQPPLTEEPASTAIHGSFSGTCSGALTDGDGRTRQLEEARARYRARGSGEVSCLGGIATGTGSLSFAGGHEIEFSFTERRPAPGLAVVTLQGDAGGSATVFGTVSAREDPVKLNERCNGSGLRVVHGDARIVSPGITG
jgi:hypothetical protein